MPKAKLHWTQTPEGRAKLSKQGKRTWRHRKGVSRNDKSEAHSEARIAPQVAYCFGRCEGFLRSYARSHGMAYADLARRVGGLLGASAGG